MKEKNDKIFSGGKILYSYFPVMKTFYQIQLIEPDILTLALQE